MNPDERGRFEGDENSEEKRYRLVLEGMKDVLSGDLEKREELINSIVSLQVRIGRQDPRVAELYKKLNLLEKNILTLKKSIKNKEEKYPEKPSEGVDAGEFEELNEDIRKFKAELVQINLEIADATSKLKYILGKNESAEDNESDPAILNLRETIKNLEENRTQTKDLIDLLEIEKKSISEE